jgi:hypothetical protein
LEDALDRSWVRQNAEWMNWKGKLIEQKAKYDMALPFNIKWYQNLLITYILNKIYVYFTDAFCEKLYEMVSLDKNKIHF